jgi:3-oxoacyl-[acyl-carrier protein] reductase
MDLNLRNKKAIVCGSTQGIGKAVAVELALLGADVVLVARDEDALKEVAGELDQNQGQRHDYLVADFREPDILNQKIQAFVQQLEAIHILVNNTGGPPGGPITEARPEEFLQAFNMHLMCNHLLVQAVSPLMKEAGYGRIINIISTSVKQPLPGLGVSNTTRGAVASWAKTMAYELGPFGITVNNVLPGSTRTGRLRSLMEGKAEKSGRSMDQVEEEMTAEIPARRFAEPEEVAAAVAFLATPAAGYINGTNVPVDGGRTGCL